MAAAHASSDAPLVVLAHSGLGPHDGLADTTALLLQLRAKSDATARPFAVHDDTTVVVLPRNQQQPSLVLTTFDRTRGGAFMSAAFAAHEIGRVSHPGGADALRLYLVPAAALDNALPGKGRRLPLQFDNGIATVAYALPDAVAAGDTLTLQLCWRIETATPPGDYRFFHHLVDDVGQGWGGWDGMRYPATAWTVGDAVVSWHDIGVPATAPAGRYWLEFGMYELATQRRVGFLDRRRDLRGAALLLGPVEVLPRPAATPQ